MTAGALANVFRGPTSNLEHRLPRDEQSEISPMTALAVARCHASCWSTADPWRKHESGHPKLCLDKRTYVRSCLMLR